MARKDRTASAASAVQAAASDITTETPIEQSKQESNVVAVATVAAVEPTSKQTMKGKSTIQYPVAHVWAHSINAFAAAKANGTAAPSRKALVSQCIAAGVAPYTARTQVQAYLKESKNGTVQPKKLPRSVVLPAAA